MRIYIKEWSDKSATIMLEDDCALWTFNTIEEALNVCRNCYDIDDVDTLLFQLPSLESGNQLLGSFNSQ